MDAKRSWTTTDHEDGDEEDNKNAGESQDDDEPRRAKVEIKRKKIVHLV
jgi:hypothetical protein